MQWPLNSAKEGSKVWSERATTTVVTGDPNNNIEHTAIESRVQPTNIFYVISFFH